jgi:hypothetical protein
MPILILILVAIFGAGWFEWENHKAPKPAATAIAPPATMGPQRVPWQQRCEERFLKAHQLAVLKGYPFFQRGEVHTGDEPANGGVWFRLVTDEGVRYSAGVSGFQSWDIGDTSWLNLNGPTGMTVYAGEMAGTGKLSLWRDRLGRSGLVAGLDPDVERMRFFTQTFQPAVDECLLMVDFDHLRPPSGSTRCDPDRDPLCGVGF